MEENMSLDQFIHAAKVQLQIFNLEGLMKFKEAMDNFIIDQAKKRLTALRAKQKDIEAEARQLESEVLNLSEKFGIK